MQQQQQQQQQEEEDHSRQGHNNKYIYVRTHDSVLSGGSSIRLFLSRWERIEAKLYMKIEEEDNDYKDRKFSKFLPYARKLHKLVWPLNYIEGNNIEGGELKCFWRWVDCCSCIWILLAQSAPCTTSTSIEHY